MDIKIGLTKQALSEVADSLQEFLATTYALYLKSQNFHWNLRAPEFFSLHLLFEKHYEDLADAVDELAERIASLGHYVEADFASFNKLSAISTLKKRPTYKQMLKELTEGHEKLAAMGKPLIRRFQDLHDEASADLLIKRLGIHEKSAWMLRSHL